MKINAVCFTKNGVEVIKRIQRDLVDITTNGYYKKSSEQNQQREVDSSEALILLEGPTSELVRESFTEGIPLVFVGAMGIAVRSIAPFIKDKLTDIPVIVIDEKAQYVIPVLSGHVGGATELARAIAESINAIPVITTATDLNDAFAVDVFARENNLTINNREGIKEVNSKSLGGSPILISVKDYNPEERADVIISEEQVAEGKLWLSRKRYVLGIGCRRGKSLKEIETLVEEELCKLGLNYSDIYAFGSIDVKSNEEGLFDFSRKHRIPFVTFSAKLLMEAPGDYTASEFVMDQVGVDNVCERAAILLTRGHGTLVVKKVAKDGVTLAIAERSIL